MLSFCAYNIERGKLRKDGTFWVRFRSGLSPRRYQITRLSDGLIQCRVLMTPSARPLIDQSLTGAYTADNALSR